MGDKHVCSLCGTGLAGKQHIKLVFENWPVEEEVIIRSRTGRERKSKRKQTKEIITALGMECISNPATWEKLDVFTEGPVIPQRMGEFFDDIRWLGKNPIFRLSPTGVCLSSSVCKQFSGEAGICIHVANPPLHLRFEEAYCYAGHPGIYRIYNKNWKPTRESLSLKRILAELKGVWNSMPNMGVHGNKKALAIYLGSWILVAFLYPPLMLAKTILGK